MTAVNGALELTKADFQSDQETRWCPGCGDYAILSAVQGLMPELECYDSCSQAWASLVHGSLRRLVTEGRGEPYAAGPLAG